MIEMGTASLALMNNLERIPIPVEDIRCGGFFWNSGVALAGAEVDDRARDDVVGPYLGALAFVFAAAELAFDADMRALLERCGVFA